MPSLLDSVDPRHLAALVAHLEQQGHSCVAALRTAGLSRAMLGQPRVPIASVLIAMQELVRGSGRSDLGFVRGLLTQVGTGDVAGQLLLSARTLRESLTHFAPYMPLVSPAIRMQVQARPEGCTATWMLARPLPYDMGIVALETVVVSFFRQVLFALQERELSCTMEFAWPAPPHAARYRELRGARVRFGAEGPLRASVHFAAPVADRPLPMADARALRAADREARATLQELVREHSFADWVRHVLHQVEDSLLTQEAVARLLRVSGKTLGRHLAREDTRFGLIAREVRQQRAEALLAHSALPVGDIAHQLGYATLANFCRSFKACRGITPGAFRAAQGGRGGGG